MMTHANHYPGTVQLCVSCNEPTGRCKEDSIYLEPEFEHQSSLGPLCEECAEERITLANDHEQQEVTNEATNKIHHKTARL